MYFTYLCVCVQLYCNFFVRRSRMQSTDRYTNIFHRAYITNVGNISVKRNTVNRIFTLVYIIIIVIIIIGVRCERIFKRANVINVQCNM